MAETQICAFIKKGTFFIKAQNNKKNLKNSRARGSVHIILAWDQMENWERNRKQTWRKSPADRWDAVNYRFFFFFFLKLPFQAPRAGWAPELESV